MAYFRCGGGSSGGAKVTLDGEPNTDSWAITYEGSTYSCPFVEIPSNGAGFCGSPRVAFKNSIYVFLNKTIYAWCEGMKNWNTLGELPYKCRQAVIYNGMIYLFLERNAGKIYIYAYNGLHLSTTGAVTEIIDWPFNINELCVVKDKIYCCSGMYENGIVLGIYDGNTITTKNVPYSLNSSSYFAIFNYKNRLHFMDLVSAESVGTLSSHKHCEYNEDTNTLTVIGVVPYVTSGSNSHSPHPSFNSCQLGERFYIISENPYAPCSIYKYDWYFDGSDWYKIDSYILNAVNVPFPVTVTYKNSIYTLGGIGSTRNYRYIDFIPNYSVTKVE